MAPEMHAMGGKVGLDPEMEIGNDERHSVFSITAPGRP